MPIDTATRLPDGTGIPAQWAGNLLPPIAFLLELEIAYLLVPWACKAGMVLPVHLAHAAALLLALTGAVIAWRQWRRWSRIPTSDGPAPEARSRFMAELAMLVSAGFTLVILALWLPTFWLHPCQ
ncbi:MAG TPA: hypothetical protein VFO71_07930 [Gemmatimonadales bacterium]|nr:hypothetical protein [Gemmatimonadales bacterium]